MDWTKKELVTLRDIALDLFVEESKVLGISPEDYDVTAITDEYLKETGYWGDAIIVYDSLLAGE